MLFFYIYASTGLCIQKLLHFFLFLAELQKWIGNEKRKRKVTALKNTNEDEMFDTPLRAPPMKRATTGYNYFCSAILSSDI